MTSFQWLKIFIIKQMWYLFHCFGSSSCICRVTPDKILLNALYNMTIRYTVDLCFKHTATWSIDCCLVCRLWFYGSMTLINLLQQVECVLNLFLFCFFNLVIYFYQSLIIPLEILGSVYWTLNEIEPHWSLSLNLSRWRVSVYFQW